MFTEYPDHTPQETKANIPSYLLVTFNDRGLDYWKNFEIMSETRNVNQFMKDIFALKFDGGNDPKERLMQASATIRPDMYRARNISQQILLSRTQAWPGRFVRKGQEHISLNYGLCLYVLGPQGNFKPEKPSNMN